MDRGDPEPARTQVEPADRSLPERGRDQAIAAVSITVLLIAGVLAAMSDKVLHAGVLIVAALVLVWDRAVDEDAPAGTRIRLPARIMVPAIVLYAIVAGIFPRYSWPSTFAVLGPAGAVLAVGWAGREGDVTPRESGTAPWIAVFLAIGLLELTMFVLQRTPSEASYAHPTISGLMNSVLDGSLGRSVTLGLWLAFGWFLVER